MAELLLELFSEEIPARMQARAAEDLQRLVTDKLKAAGLTFTSAKSFVTPRRLALVIDGLPLAQPDVKEEKKGPRVGSPQQAVDGFLKSAGLASLDQCEKRDTGKGEFYFAVIDKKGVTTAAILPEIILAAMSDLPWPKSMRWAGNTQRWVRPLHSIVALLDGKVLSGAFDLGGDKVTFGDKTKGHRFLSSGEITVTTFADYQTKLKAAKVILDQAERRAEIKKQAEAAAAKEGLTVKQDDGLLDEVTGLVEWPTVLVGKIDDEFMSVPHEVLTTSMRVNQKYFALLDKSGKLAPRFLVTANIEANDGGAAIIHGNERVLRARLSDAKFFWDQDLKVALEDRVQPLGAITYHAKLGTVLDKVGRVKQLSRQIAIQLTDSLSFTNVDLQDVALAARLAKADLVSGMVGEFPELQGIMGRYYARHEKLPDTVADAIADHYKPLGPTDTCPSAPVSVAVALADKIDTLTGFFAVNEKPTGSKDPFALRRAALGVIRLILENNLRLELRKTLRQASEEFPSEVNVGTASADQVVSDLIGFFGDRLKVALKEQGIRHDYIAAAFALGDDDLWRVVERAKALKLFLESDDGANLLIASRRAANIVRLEEEKDGVKYDSGVDANYLVAEEDKKLLVAIETSRRECVQALQSEAYVSVMQALAKLRAPVDAFFDKVKVNVDDKEVRANRLQMLAAINTVLFQVADFSKIEG